MSLVNRVINGLFYFSPGSVPVFSGVDDIHFQKALGAGRAEESRIWGNSRRRPARWEFRRRGSEHRTGPWTGDEGSRESANRERFCEFKREWLRPRPVISGIHLQPIAESAPETTGDHKYVEIFKRL